MSKLSKNILKKIEAENIKPRPKWQFIAMHVSLFALFGLSILLGSMVTGMIIREIVMTAWEFAPHIKGVSSLLLLVMPLIWAASLALVTCLAYKIFSKTKKGYKYKPTRILAISIVISILLGAGAHYLQFSSFMDNVMSDHIPSYAGLREKVEGAWDHTDEKMMMGEVIELGEEGLITVVNRQGETWSVVLSPEYFEDIEIGDELMMRGERGEDQTFTAEKMREHGPGPGGPQKGERK